MECMICANAKALGKLEPDKPPIYCLIATFIPIVGIFLLRQTARETYGIEVTLDLQKHNLVRISYMINCNWASILIYNVLWKHYFISLISLMMLKCKLILSYPSSLDPL